MRLRACSRAAIQFERAIDHPGIVFAVPFQKGIPLRVYDPQRNTARHLRRPIRHRHGAGPAISVRHREPASTRFGLGGEGRFGCRRHRCSRRTARRCGMQGLHRPGGTVAEFVIRKRGQLLEVGIGGQIEIVQFRKRFIGVDVPRKGRRSARTDKRSSQTGQSGPGFRRRRRGAGNNLRTSRATSARSIHECVRGHGKGSRVAGTRPGRRCSTSAASWSKIRAEGTGCCESRAKGTPCRWRAGRRIARHQGGEEQFRREDFLELADDVGAARLIPVPWLGQSQAPEWAVPWPGVPP